MNCPRCGSRMVKTWEELKCLMCGASVESEEAVEARRQREALLTGASPV